MNESNVTVLSEVKSIESLGPKYVMKLEPEEGFISMFFFIQDAMIYELEFLRELEKAFHDLKIQSEFRFVGDNITGSSGLQICYKTKECFANWRALALKHTKVFKCRIKQVFKLQDFIGDIESLEHGEHIDNNYYEVWFFEESDPMGGKIVKLNEFNKMNNESNKK